MQKQLEATRNKVKSYLESMYGEKFEEFDNGERFIGYEGSTVVQLIVRPWGEDETVVECLCYVVYSPKVNEELLTFLLRENSKMHFGGFSLSFDDTVVYSHSIAGSNLDENELKITVETVSKISDYYDDMIIKNFGGMTAQQALETKGLEM
ncbi:MAG: hypothetical protein DWQ06_13260 [Calditrichaeota bacterium]|nr:MAG: hypothetical protein DWQ06_13260 [Calditrichota bacterium]